ncbi:MAG TPA: response regulator [Polyangiaceae bacterium]|nr:response regulator [Polyangiaceae bacterium]
MTQGAPQEELVAAPAGEEARAQDAHELARELARTKAELLRTRTLTEALIGYLSHELRMPMTVIIGSSQLLLESELDPVQRDVLGAVQDSGKSLFTIVTDVFDYARFDSGALCLARRDFDLGAVLRDVCEASRSKPGHEDVLLTLTLDSAVPHYARGDSARLRQILSTVLAAAIRSSKTAPLELRVGARAVGEELELSCQIADTGHDLADPPTHELSSGTALSGKRPFAGIGLGLALAVKLAELMRGSIEVFGRPPAGSAFRVRLLLEPCAGESIATSTPPSWRTPSSIPGWDDVRRTVLVAEDDALNQVIVARALETLGCETSFAGSGKEAVEALKQHAYDAVLMDCEMPDLDGFEATAQIRKLPGEAGKVPIIALTANAAPGDRERCLSAGMNDYLSKPFSLSELRAKLVLHLSGDALRIVMPDDGRVDPQANDPIDRTRLNEIGSPELVHELTQIFLQDMAVRLQSLADAHAAQQETLLERGAHAVKGACGNFGARRMALLAESIEKNPRCDAAAAEAIAGLHAEFARVRSVLTREDDEGAAQELALAANNRVPAPSRTL